MLSCSTIARQPFAPPQRRGEKREAHEVEGMIKEEEEEEGEGDVKVKKEMTGVDMEGWKALYEKPFHKEIEIKPRNRIHDEMIEMAEEEKDVEKPQLPVGSVQNALVFKRMAARKQLLGGLI